MYRSQVKTRPERDNIPQLVLVTLTGPNKRRLFHDSIQASKNSIEKTEELIARLEQFDPSTAQEFGFKNVAISQAPFRLLCSVPMWVKAVTELKNTFGRSTVEKGKSYWTSSSSSDTQFDSFIALSYCWHNQDWTPAPGCQPRKGWPISSMMLQALLDQRQSPYEGVWIDAWCIDQSNKTEKMHAVGSVDVVYRSARLVVIILEDVYLPKEEVDAIRASLANGRYQGCPNEQLPTVRRGCTRILSSRWFSRAWCSHEFQLGANSLFLIPTESGPIPLTMRLLQDFYFHGCYDSFPSNIIHRAFTTLITSFETRNWGGWRRSLMAQFAGIIELNASLETDKIGIASNVAGLQLYFAGPQKSEHQCRWIFVMLALSAGDMTSLCGNDEKIHLDPEGQESSWLHWNSDDENFIASLGAPNFPSPSQIFAIEPSHAILDLYMLENCAFHRPSESSTLKATCFVDRHFNTITGLSLSPETRSPTYQESRMHRIEALACSLDCGLAWLAANITFNQDVACEMSWKMDAREIDFWPMIADLLIDVYPSEEAVLSNFRDEQKRSVSLYIYYLMSDLQHSLTTSWSLSDMLDPKGNPWARLDLGTVCGKALTPSLCVGFADYHFAVPAALGGPNCATINRLWLLLPRGSVADDEWSVVAKFECVTFMPIEADGKHIIYRPRQTIRG